MANDWRESYVLHLQGLYQNKDRAALAALRAGLRGRPEDNFQAARYVYPWLPPELYEQGVKNAFLIGALYALHPLPGGSGSLGASVGRMKSKSSSIEKRMLALVDADRRALGTHLRHMVALLKSADIPIDWLKLLKDVSSWSNPERRVQRKWVRDFYTDLETKEDKKEDV